MSEAVTPPVPGSQRWVTLMAHDLAASRHFYHALFGWEYHEGPQQLGPYVQAVREGRQVAGLGEVAPGACATVSWLPYIATDDADATATRVRGCGGTVAVGPLDVAGVGRLAIAADVFGAAFGLWQGGRGRRSPLREPEGVPVWNELITADAARISPFYAMVFGYEARPEPALSEGTDYLVLRLADRPAAGIRGVDGLLPHDRGPHWLPYFSAADVDSAAHRALPLGARLLRAPEDSPWGRMAWLADPEGAPFALIRPARETQR